jgi:hypothetical protein
MATKLTKPVTRMLEDWSDGSHGRDRNRPLMVTLNPAGFITFRLWKFKQAYDLSFGMAFHMAVKRFSDRQIMENKKKRAARKAGLV